MEAMMAMFEKDGHNRTEAIPATLPNQRKTDNIKMDVHVHRQLTCVERCGESWILAIHSEILV
jgi:hypothetical protein